MSTRHTSVSQSLVMASYQHLPINASTIFAIKVYDANYFNFRVKKILYLFLQQKSKDSAILCLETTTLFAWLIFGVKSWPAYATLRISHWRPPRFVSVNCTMSSTNLRLFIASEFRLLKPTAFSSNNISSNILSASKWNSDNYISRNLSKSAVILKVTSKRI